MDTIQIQHALQGLHSFLGVYASDLLPLSIAQTGAIIVTQTLTQRPAPTGRPYIFKTPTASLAVIFSIHSSLSTHSQYPRFHTASLYILAIQQNATPRTYDYSLRRILLPLRSIYGQGLYPETI